MGGFLVLLALAEAVSHFNHILGKTQKSPFFWTPICAVAIRRWWCSVVSGKDQEMNGYEDVDEDNHTLG